MSASLGQSIAARARLDGRRRLSAWSLDRQACAHWHGVSDSRETHNKLDMLVLVGEVGIHRRDGMAWSAPDCVKVNHEELVRREGAEDAVELWRMSR